MSRPPIRWSLLPAVIAGGAVGAALRYALVVSDADAVVVTTAAINLVGAFLLGVVAGAVADRRPRLRAFLGTGVLGGFTTYSAFAVQTASLLAEGAAIALLGAVVLAATATAAALAGLAVGTRLVARRSS
ncbi:fluoride efflux transporter FluC [Microbacterium gilvum]|uniref:Fluoride-specific ion channel FluC n=1 Tax=Microbacterium gilvum TaxID=1336204 RepID=A0ABP8ZYC6_9MICO